MVGAERERIRRGAGLKTHVLVSVGSALFAIVSIYGFVLPGRSNDPSRLAAQIVSGIGFLGAGTIMKQGSTVRGLTTAASLWVVAGIGTAAGTGLYQAAIVATAVVIVSMFLFKRIERLMGRHPQTLRLQMRVKKGADRIDRLRDVLVDMGLNVQRLRMRVNGETIRLRVVVEAPDGHIDHAGLVQRLHEAGANHVEW